MTEDETNLGELDCALSLASHNSTRGEVHKRWDLGKLHSSCKIKQGKKGWNLLQRNTLRPHCAAVGAPSTMGRRRRKKSAEPDYLLLAMRLHQRSHLFLEEIPLEDIEQTLIAFGGNEEEAIEFLEDQWASYFSDFSDWEESSESSDCSDFYDHFGNYDDCESFPERPQCRPMEGLEERVERFACLQVERLTRPQVEQLARPQGLPITRLSIWPTEMRAVTKENPATLRLQPDGSMEFECLSKNIGRIVGLKGAMCKRIRKETGCGIDVDFDYNIVTIMGPSEGAMRRAHRLCLDAVRDTRSTPVQKIRQTCGGKKKKSKQKLKRGVNKNCDRGTMSRERISKLALRKILKADGWKRVRCNNHAVFKRDIGNGTVQTISCSLTPSDYRAYTKIKLDLRSMNEERDRLLALSS